jgi:hypothetical protein
MSTTRARERGEISTHDQNHSGSAASLLLVQVPAKQPPDGHVVPSALLVVPAHTPEAGLHVPGLRQGPASAVQSRLLALHKSAYYSRNTVTFTKYVCAQHNGTQFGCHTGNLAVTVCNALLKLATPPLDIPFPTPFQHHVTKKIDCQNKYFTAS